MLHSTWLDTFRTDLIDQLQFIYLSTDGHLNCFYFGAIMNNAAMTINL